VFYNRRMNAQSSIACLVHIDQLLAVEALTGRAQLNSYTLAALEAVLEAVVLYDQLIIYENSPLRLLLELGSAEDRLYGYDAPEDQPLPFIYRLYKEHVLDWGNAYTIEQAKTRTPPTFNSGCSYRGVDGRIYTPMFLQSATEDVTALGRRRGSLEIVEPLVRESLRLISNAALPEYIHPSERTNFIQDHASVQMFELDSARSLCSAKDADALLMTPPSKPFYSAEQTALRSAVHNQFLKLQDGLAELVRANAVTFDHTPLLAVALDTTLERHMLVETIFQMRSDYKELRDVGRNYKAQLQGADLYKHRVEAIQEWNRNWDAALSRIGKQQTGLLGQIFSWDVLKKGTIKGALLESAGKVANSIQDLQVAQTVRVVHRFAEEFEFSRPIEKRIEDLFGGFDNSPFSPWTVFVLG
jgi:hypothetical protein